MVVPKRKRAKKQRKINLQCESYQGYFKMLEGKKISHKGAMNHFGLSSSTVSVGLSIMVLWGYFEEVGRGMYVRTAKTPPVGKWEKKPRRKYGLRKPANQPELPMVTPGPKTLEVTKAGDEVTLTLGNGLRMIGTKEQIAEKLIDEL